MKRSVLLMFLVLLAIILPVCALADSDTGSTLGVGESYTYSSWQKYGYGLSSESLTPAIISVNFNRVTALSPGTGIIRCTYTKWNDPTPVVEEKQITVCPAPDSIVFSEPSIKLGAGEQFTLNVVLPEGTCGAVYYNTNTPTISFTGDGKSVHIWTHEVGIWQVSVQTYNGKSAVCQVEVVPGPTSLILSPSSLTLYKGQTYQLTTEIVGGYTRNGITFFTPANNVCSVSNTGLVTALNAGQTYVDARVYPPCAGYCQITVYDEPDSISLDGITSSFSVGDSISFIPKDSAGNPLYLPITFSDPTVLKSEPGNILKALKAGVCTVTVASQLQSANMEITVLPAPTTLTLSPSEISMKELDTVALTATLTEGTKSAIKYASSNTAIATVSDEGVIHSIKPGSVTISGTTYNGVVGYCNATVITSERTYTLLPASATVGMNKTLQLHLTDMTGNTIPATYVVNNNIANVDGNGLVTCLYRGTVDVTATVEDGRTYQSHINIIAIPEYITVSPEEMYLIKGDGEYFSVNSDIGDLATYEYTYTSSNPNVAATVAGGHEIIGVGKGTAIITVTTTNGKTAEIFVTVYPENGPLIPGVGFAALLGVGQSKNLNVRDMYGRPVACTYSTSDPSSAKVSSKGKITGLSGNTICLITATSKDDRQCDVLVGVYPAPGFVRLNADTLHMPRWGTVQLVPEVSPDSIPIDITFTSSKASVATVSADGLITGQGFGTCTVTAKTYNGKTDKVVVTVGSAPTFVTLSPDTLYLGVNESRTLQTTLSKGAAGAYTFAAVDTGIASVSDGGTVTGLAAGSTTVTVTTYNGLSDTSNVVVLNAPDSLTLQSPLNILGIKQTVQLQTALTPGSASTITYSTSNPKVATVSGSGLVTGIKTGNVTITAQTYNGLTSSVSLEVKKAPANIKLSKKNAKLGVGESLKLTATLSAGSEGTYAFTSSNSGIATVDQSGLVTALRPGKVTITVQTHNGKKATCTVTVYPLPINISVKSANTILLGRSFTLPVTYPRNTYASVTYVSSAPLVAKVDAAGKVTGIAPGVAIITVTAFGGAVAQCVVTVN